MKQYTDEIQTAKLIELGFKKPESIIDAWAYEKDIDIEYVYEYAYSIGELIKMLPKHTDDSDILHIEAYDFIGWDVWYGCYCNGDEVSVEYSAENKELIDALYDMVVKLKEEGVI
jgi:hypothetical protein